MTLVKARMRPSGSPRRHPGGSRRWRRQPLRRPHRPLLPPLLLLLLVLLPGLPGGEVAAQTAEELRRDWERQRATVLAYVEAMPEEALGFRPTPGVRTFAEQIEHIVEDHVRIAATVFERDDAPDLGDPDRSRERTDALADHVRTGFDYVLGILEEATEEELREEGDVFGRYRVPRRRALAGALEHGTWTLGQTVPYLRLQGAEPPPYQVFDPGTLIDGEN